MMRSLLLVCFLVVCAFTVSVVADDSERHRTTYQAIDVDRAVAAIEVRSQLRALERIFDELHEARLERAMLSIDDSTTKQQMGQADLKLKLLENLKETAILQARELASRLENPAAAEGS